MGKCYGGIQKYFFGKHAFWSSLVVNKAHAKQLFCRLSDILMCCCYLYTACLSPAASMHLYFNNSL
jgi:hypothetical protein